MTKPLGVRIIAIVCFLEVSSAAVATRHMFPLIYQLVKSSNDGPSNGLAEIAAAVVLDGFVVTVLYFLTGWGLWTLKNWARVLAIILNALAAAFELLRWLFRHHLGVSNIISIGIAAVIIFYLTKPSVVAVFSHGSVGVRRVDELA